jgi:exopolysaccharide biosynthesis polyprenyl glycosylphosphotransferase
MGHVERRKRETLLQFFWHVTDVLAVLAAFLAGYWLRFRSPLVGRVWDLSKGVPPLTHYMVAAVATVIVWVAVFHAAGLYRRRLRWDGAAVSRLLRASLLGMVITAGITFFYREITLSRIAIPLIWMIAIPLLHAGRTLGFRLSAALTHGRPLRFLIIGRTPQAYRLARALAADDGLPHEGVGILVGPGEDTAVGDEDPLPILGRYDQVGEVVAAQRVDSVFVALALTGQAALIEILRQCQQHEVDVEFVPDLVGLMAREAHFDEIDGLPIASLREIPLAGWNGVLKRTLDLAITVPILTLLAPFLLFVALLIVLDSRGPVLYRQERVGRDRKTFKIIKFRSMCVDAEHGTGPVWADRDDPRRTRLGVFMRTWSVDELPQFINVLKGEMSLVGPRPERPYFVERFRDLVPDYFARHRVKSGITGWAQVNGLRGNVPIEERTRYDIFYVENWSLAFDLRILLLTMRSVFAARGH